LSARKAILQQVEKSLQNSSSYAEQENHGAYLAGSDVTNSW
jgi:hypothetical protein